MMFYRIRIQREDWTPPTIDELRTMLVEKNNMVIDDGNTTPEVIWTAWCELSDKLDMETFLKGAKVLNEFGLVHHEFADKPY
jgi:hypothetical protein